MNRGITAGLVTLVMIGARAVGAGEAHMVLDINSTIISVDSGPGNFSDQGAWSYFTASDGASPPLPWSTNGTSAARLATPEVLTTGNIESATYRAGGLTYFTVPNYNRGTALWVTNGTAAGTREVVPFDPYPTFIGAFGNELAYLRYDDADVDLWLTDGTAAGTRTISNLSDVHGNAQSAIVANGKIYLLVQILGSASEPWVSDGTPAGTHSVGPLPLATAGHWPKPSLARAGRYVVFTATTSDRGGEMWSIDTQTESLTPLPEVAPGTDSGIDDSTGAVPPRLTSVGDIVLFIGTPSAGVRELWRTDGTPGGTWRLSTAAPYASYHQPEFRGPVGTGRYLFAADNASVPELHGTDGSSVETLLSGTPVELLGQVGSNYYFSKYDTTLGWYEVWRTDGTAAGTHRLTGFGTDSAIYEVAGDTTRLFVRQRLADVGGADAPASRIFEYDLQTDEATLIHSIPKVQGGSIFPVFAFAQGRLYFDGANAVTGHELWAWESAAEGAHEVRNIAPESQTESASPENFIELDGKLFFTADDGHAGREWWTSDGTADGTRLLVDLWPGEESSQIRYAFTGGGQLYFFAKDGFSDFKLWRSDGTAQGTTALLEVEPPTSPCSPLAVTEGTYVYFQAATDDHGDELWRSDGTSSGTRRVTDIFPGSPDSQPCDLVPYAGRIYFSATSGAAPGERHLWSVDTRSLAVRSEAGLFPDPPGWATPVLAWNGTLYLNVYTEDSGTQLWKSDGTAAGTIPVTSFDPATPRSLRRVQSAGNRLVFETQTGTSLPEVWGSDGTSAGTSRVGYSHAANASSQITASGAAVYFPGLSDSAEYPNVEPWVTNGTAQGTRRVLDIEPEGGSFPFGYTDFTGITLFQVSTGTPANRGLWRTDGTAEGTRRLSDVLPMQVITIPYTPQPPRQATAGQSFFFMSNDGHSGAELFAITNDAPVAANDAAASVQAGKSVIVSVLENDADPDGLLDVASVAIESDPAHGTVEVNADGSITYFADAGYAGADTFSYSVGDQQGARTHAATVSVTVSEAPEPPAKPEGKGGGGTWALGELVALALLLLRRRRAIPA